MSNFENRKYFSKHSTTGFILTGFMFGFIACNEPQTTTPMMKTVNGAETCQGNDDGWYCYTNPSLNVASGDEFFDTDLIHCSHDSVDQVKSCTQGCEVKPQSVDDVCASGTTTPVCGNGLIEGIEQCDLLNLNGQTCASGGYNGGTLVCTASCQLDSGNCCNHSCTGDTQCVGTTKQTCQDGNNDGCNEWVNTGTCPVNPVCGNGLIEGSEVCDSTNMNGHSCTTEGYDGGTAACSGSCTVSTGACCNDACTSGTQCVNNVEQTCQTGSNGCKTWVDTGTCAPTCTTTISSNLCNTYTSSAGGLYEIFEICAESVGPDRIKIHMRKNPSSSFGQRPYGVKVFGLGDAECSHATHFYNEANSSVTVDGVNSNELTMEFNVTWVGTQTDKRFCGYAKTISTDLAYDSTSNEQKIWWYSRSLSVHRSCN